MPLNTKKYLDLIFYDHSSCLEILKASSYRLEWKNNQKFPTLSNQAWKLSRGRDSNEIKWFHIISYELTDERRMILRTDKKKTALDKSCWLSWLISTNRGSSVVYEYKLVFIIYNFNKSLLDNCPPPLLHQEKVFRMIDSLNVSLLKRKNKTLKFLIL